MSKDSILQALKAAGFEPLADGVEIPLKGQVSPLVRGYLAECVTLDGFDASGVGILGADQLRREAMPESAPGGPLLPYGYVVIATSIGGNAVIVSAATGLVYWANSSAFSDPVELSWEDRSTGEYVDAEWSNENVARALVDLSVSLDDFIVGALKGEWEERLDDLD
jgi:hypothetical protein